MSKRDLKDLGTANEIDLTVKGRKSGLDISRPVGLFMKMTNCICFLCRVRIQIGIEMC
jgi:hypothetical protein